MYISIELIYLALKYFIRICSVLDIDSNDVQFSNKNVFQRYFEFNNICNKFITPFNQFHIIYLLVNTYNKFTYFGSDFIYLTFRNYVVNLAISFIIFAWKKFSKLFCSVLPWLLVVTGGVIHCIRKYGGTSYVTLRDLKSYIAEINYLTIYTDCKEKALILLMFIFIIPFFTLPTFFPLYPPFMYSGTIWLPYSAGATCCTPEAVIYGAQDHFRDNYIPNPNNLILYYDLQSAYVTNDNCITFYIELILFKYFSILNYIHKPLHKDIKNTYKYFTENIFIMRMSRVTYNLQN